MEIPQIPHFAVSYPHFAVSY